ncbi:MAG: hypothetical protein K1X78_28430 [Verrucomicrobiaceae bacterium]|nr:hypothetical protein [Verrucomicrobiaceae bacterium]
MEHEATRSSQTDNRRPLAVTLSHWLSPSQPWHLKRGGEDAAFTSNGLRLRWQLSADPPRKTFGLSTGVQWMNGCQRSSERKKKVSDHEGVKT